MQSLGFALDGLRHVYKTEANFTIHIVLSFIALLLAFILQISRLEIIAVIIMITLGLATELANTAIEEMIDLVTVEHRKEAKIAKDVAAGMMLIVAIGSILMGFIIYTPYLIKSFQ